MHGLAAWVFASECYKLTVPERRWLAEATFRACRGRVPVIVGTSGTNTAETVELSQHAEEIGARAVFVAPPLFGGAALDVLIPYFCAVSAAVSIPVIVQDGHIPIAPAQVARLAELYPNVSYVKEEAPLSRPPHHGAAGPPGRPAHPLRRTYLLDDRRAARRAIPGSVGVADLSRAYDAFVAGDIEAARAAYDHFTPLSHWRRPFRCWRRRRCCAASACSRRPPAGAVGQRLDEQDLRELTAIMERMGPPY